MLFDVYYSLGRFCVGLCTVGAYIAKAKRDDALLGVAIALIVFALWSAAFRRHFRTHADMNDWSRYRRIVPLVFYLIGIAAVAAVEWRTLVG